MEDLQDNIIRVLDLSETGYITQQEAWDRLNELEIIEPTMDKDFFLCSYLKIVNNYNDIYLQIIDNVYYLKKTNCTPKFCEVSLFLSIEQLINLIVNNEIVSFDTVIGANGDTVTHYIVLLKNLSGIEKATVSDFLITNNIGKSPLDNLSSTDTILKSIITKLDTTNQNLKQELTKVNVQLSTNIKCVKYLKSKYQIPQWYYIIVSVFFGIMVKFLFDKIYY